MMFNPSLTRSIAVRICGGREVGRQSAISPLEVLVGDSPDLLRPAAKRKMKKKTKGGKICSCQVIEEPTS